MATELQVYKLMRAKVRCVCCVTTCYKLWHNRHNGRLPGLAIRESYGETVVVHFGLISSDADLKPILRTHLCCVTWLAPALLLNTLLSEPTALHTEWSRKVIPRF